MREREARSKRCGEREETVRKRKDEGGEATESDTKTIWCLQASAIPADCLI